VPACAASQSGRNGKARLGCRIPANGPAGGRDDNHQLHSPHRSTTWFKQARCLGKHLAPMVCHHPETHHYRPARTGTGLAASQWAPLDLQEIHSARDRYQPLNLNDASRRPFGRSIAVRLRLLRTIPRLDAKRSCSEANRRCRCDLAVRRGLRSHIPRVPNGG
jgi:hypothetical protein